jgi:transposase-like protein
MPILTKPRSLSEYDRAMLRATLAFLGGPTPAVFTSENVRGLLGADETCMTCPRCGGAVQGRVDSDKRCEEFRCDECCYAFAKST